MDRLVNELIVIDKFSLQPGDVLLSYAAQMMDEPGCETGYCHAAIYLGSGEILESDAQGVKKSSVEDILLAYDHIAVMRSEDIWSSARIEALRDFASRHIGKKFNIRALPRIELLRQLSVENPHQEIIDYFAGRATPVEADRETYFCSELVTSAFIDAGIISESAALLFKPETLMPIDIAQDKVFGFFFGYIPKRSNYVIPSDDWFRSNI
ncbi:hypothetical protein B1806_15340 [Metallibacterium scheffleri]|uniref:Permuted papain-like amidase YaeF/Yiix C92 family enzyme n=1 Tax=Metallibacterium scheffleri TaxID=993689 RepID=A0A4S3KEY2_9GAMM|nr:hypothetical protein B1806_15340 [Metallibacterium scheffleri]